MCGSARTPEGVPDCSGLQVMQMLIAWAKNDPRSCLVCLRLAGSPEMSRRKLAQALGLKRSDVCNAIRRASLRFANLDAILRLNTPAAKAQQRRRSREPTPTRQGTSTMGGLVAGSQDSDFSRAENTETAFTREKAVL